MAMTVEEVKSITDIVNDSVATIKEGLENKMESGFKLLNETITKNQENTTNQIKNRVSDVTCFTHRGSLDKKITILETRAKISNGTLVVLLPIAIIGIVYGILMYQKVEDLRDKISNPPIVKTIDI